MSRKSIVILSAGILILSIGISLIFNIPVREPLTRTLHAWKLTYADRSFTEPVSDEPVQVRLDGAVYRCRSEPDYYSGTIEIDGYPPVPWPDERAALGEPIFRMDWPEEGIKSTPIYQNFKDTDGTFHLEREDGNIPAAYVSADGTLLCFPVVSSVPENTYIITHPGTAEEAAALFLSAIWASWQTPSANPAQPE